MYAQKTGWKDYIQWFQWFGNYDSCFLSFIFLLFILCNLIFSKINLVTLPPKPIIKVSFVCLRYFVFVREYRNVALLPRGSEGTCVKPPRGQHCPFLSGATSPQPSPASVAWVKALLHRLQRGNSPTEPVGLKASWLYLFISPLPLYLP